MRAVVSLGCGVLFGLGLVISDMIDPARVLAFLDVASGAWDPTLAFVMAGAMAPMIAAWALTARLKGPVLADAFPARPAATLDRALIGGSALFGAGWGLVGFCPGPALAALALGGWGGLVFVAALMVGLFVGGRVDLRPVSA